MKEISSDGDISTVDVIYPSSPFWLLLAPDTLRLMTVAHCLAALLERFLIAR
jgi:hypothetical protein